MTQENKVCGVCNELGHSKFYCKTRPRTPIKRTAIKPSITKKKPKIKRLTRSHLVRKLDSIFSQYIRQSKSVDGVGTCVTCGRQKPWKEMQNGHYFSRGRYPTRWSEDNCHIQDAACNVFLKGNYIPYTFYMIDKYGREYVESMEKLSKSNVKITTVEIQEMIEKYRNMLT